MALPSRLYVLDVLDRAGGAMRAADVATAAGLEPGPVLSLLGQLASEGLVERHEVIRKRRGREPIRKVVGYTITDEGRAALAVARIEARRFAEGTWAGA